MKRRRRSTKAITARQAQGNLHEAGRLVKEAHKLVKPVYLQVERIDPSFTLSERELKMLLTDLSGALGSIMVLVRQLKQVS
jgi:hypothetical protein